MFKKSNVIITAAIVVSITPIVVALIVDMSWLIAAIKITAILLQFTSVGVLLATFINMGKNSRKLEEEVRKMEARREARNYI